MGDNLLSSEFSVGSDLVLATPQKLQLHSQFTLEAALLVPSWSSACLAGVGLVTVAVGTVLGVVTVTVAAVTLAILMIHVSSPAPAGCDPKGTGVVEGTWVVTGLEVMMVAVALAEVVISAVDGVAVVVVGAEAGSIGTASPQSS